MSQVIHKYDVGIGEEGSIILPSYSTALSVGIQDGRAVLQSQDADEVMEMALCESRRLVLRIGQAYRFVPVEGCKTCEEMKAEHDQAYAIVRAAALGGMRNE